MFLLQLVRNYKVNSLSVVKNYFTFIILIIFNCIYCIEISNKRLKSPDLSPDPYQTLSRNYTMEENTFNGKKDNYNGISIDLAQEPFVDFQQKLQKSLTQWKSENVRGVWFNISLNQADVIPILTKNGFVFHHASKDGSTLIMTKWLPQDCESRIPGYAHTMIGAGAVVLNDKNQVLVVKEFYRQRPQWKLPGGYVELSEDIGAAAIREVEEETNIKTEFHSVVAFRHTHKAAFGCSDIYFIVRLKPLTETITKDDREITESQWMDVDEFFNHPEVHENNRMFVRKCIENPTEIQGISSIHPILKHQQYLYYSAMKSES